MAKNQDDNKRVKRNNGEGTDINEVQINGVTYYTWSISFKDENGITQRKSLKRKRRQDVVFEKKEILKEIANGTLTSKTDNMTLEKWLEIWASDFKKKTVKQSTYENYIFRINKYILPYFKNVDINKVDTIMIQKYITTLAEKGLSSATIKEVIITLKSSLKKAFELKKLKKMPVGIELPKVVETEIHVLTDEQREVIRKSKSRFKVCYLLALLGMRRSEIMGLTWDCVSLEEKRLYIKKILKLDNKREENFYFDTPKSKNSVRTVFLTDEIVELMYEQIERQEKMKNECDRKDFNKFNLVFTTGKGEFLYPNALLQTFKYLMKKNGLHQSRLHDCRHTFCTDLAEANVNIATTILLSGHKDVRALQRYLHPDEQTLINAIEKISHK